MKRFCSIFLLPLCLVLLCACSAEKTDTKKMRDIEFTVVDPEEIPEELASRIDQDKAGAFQLTFGDNGYLYIARGYGTKDTSGYSVEVPQCFETSNAIRIKTNLLGPSREEKVLQKPTYPYIVIKIEYSDKNVVFD